MFDRDAEHIGYKFLKRDGGNGSNSHISNLSLTSIYLKSTSPEYWKEAMLLCMFKGCWLTNVGKGRMSAFISVLAVNWLKENHLHCESNLLCWVAFLMIMVIENILLEHYQIYTLLEIWASCFSQFDW